MDLSYNSFTDSAGKHIAKSLALNTSLATLIMEANTFGNSTAECLLFTLVGNKTIHKISLKKNLVRYNYLVFLKNMLTRNVKYFSNQEIPDTYKEIERLATENNKYQEINTDLEKVKHRK